MTTTFIDPLLDFEDKVPVSGANTHDGRLVLGDGLVPFGMRFARSLPRMDKHATTYKTVHFNEDTTLHEDGTVRVIKDTQAREVED